MAYNESTEVQVLVYPEGNLPTPDGHRFALHETIGGVLARAQGDSVESATATDLPSAWSGQNGFSHIDSTLDVLRLYNDGTAAFGTNGLTGAEILTAFVLKRTTIPFNCRTQTVYAGDPDSQNDFPDLHFKQTRPRVTPVAPERLRTKLPSQSPLRTRIQYHDASETIVVSAQSVEKLTANQMLRFDIGWLQGVEGETKANARFIWGGKWSIARRQNVEPTLDLMVNGEWQIQARLGDWMPYHGDEAWIIERLAGVIVLTCVRPDATRVFWVAEKTPGGDLVTATWPKATVRMSLYGVAATFGVSKLTTLENDGTPRFGTAQRRRKHAIRYNGAPTLRGDTKGWYSRGTDTQLDVAVTNKYADYVLTLTADPEGIDTPAVVAVLAQAPRAFSTAEDGAIDIRPACIKLTGKSADPVMAGTASAEWTIECDRHLLKEFVDANWESKVKKYVPIQINIRRRRSDGTRTAWYGVFSGYIRDPEKANPAFNDWKMTLHCWDETIRITKPAGVLKPKNHLPLDYLANRATPVYSGDCIAEIARIELGDVWADTMNGNGDPRAFAPYDPPIMDLLYAIEEDAPNSNQLSLPVPYYQDAISWMKTIGEKARCVFFFGKVPQYPTAYPVLIYGRYGNIVAGRTPKAFYDAEYVGGDLNRLLLDVKTQNIPDKDINEVVVIGTLQRGDGDTAAAVSAEAQLAVDDPNNADNSWPRTLVAKSKYVDYSGTRDNPAAGAQHIATTIIREFANFGFDAPSFKGRGDETMQFGDPITLQMNSAQSDTALGLNGRTFRVLTWTHDILLMRERVDDFTTDVTLAQVSASGI